MPIKPSEKEQEYFLKQEAARLKKLREEHMHASLAAERQKMKELHYLRCCKCGQKMEVETIENIEIDVCPDCYGIYLDAGELAKILDEKTRSVFSATMKKLRTFMGID